uniref:Reverse transcriptase domain-containing protein n=1 Tax=Astatotilapia calliptera TaxID=8154 RepID=A0AAX7TX13_ASTCA
MPISKLCPPVVRSSWHFKWMPEGLTYLGIKLTPGLDNIMQVNISPVIQNIRPLLQNWVKINLSLLGRINLVKMIIAPKLQYFLHMLPIAVPHNLLKLYNTSVEGFVWAGKKPRLKMATLQMSSRVGGVDLPNLRLYQLAIHLTVIADWLRCDSTPIWLDIESSQSKCPLFNLLKRSVKSKNSPTILLSYALSRFLTLAQPLASWLLNRPGKETYRLLNKCSRLAGDLGLCF